ncbi:MAG: hypothetical protein J2P36_33110, partial [Ktedonobacteraceae bacterium]|nr:hypothetical protein [Ktedonobacteraceae bacterium]
AVSSTQVRQALGTAHVPREVYRFMHDTRAYAPPRNQRNGTTIDDYAERVKRLRRLGIPLP